jgi:hypothetical protein
MARACAFRMSAQHLQELAAFRLCEELMKLVEAETAKDPIARHFKFCDQLNDAALDAASDVAEGFVRYYPRDFAAFSTTRSHRCKRSALAPKPPTVSSCSRPRPQATS